MSIFTQIWEFIVINIVPILASTQFGTIAGGLFYLIKTRKRRKENTETNKQLVAELARAKKENEELRSEIKDLKTKIYKQSEKQLDIEEIGNQGLAKLDGILSVLQTVYSGLKPEVATTVNNIVNNVKYTTNKTRDKIAGNLEAVKEALETATKAIENKVDETKRIVGKDDIKRPTL